MKYALDWVYWCFSQVLFILTQTRSWYFPLCFSTAAKGMKTCPKRECPHWEEEGRAIKTVELKRCVTARQRGPCFRHHNLRSHLTAVFYGKGQESREVTWIHIVSPPLCVPASLVGTAGLTSTFTTANRKAGVLCETDGDTERQCKYLDF